MLNKTLASMAVAALCGCATPGEELAQLSPKAEKYHSPECRKARAGAQHYDDRVAERMAAGAVTGLLLGPAGVPLVAGLPVAAALDAGQAGQRMEVVHQLRQSCSGALPRFEAEWMSMSRLEQDLASLAVLRARGLLTEEEYRTKHDAVLGDRNTSLALSVGDTLFVRDIERSTARVLAERAFKVSAVDANGIRLNEGTLVLDVDGQASAAPADSLLLSGVRLRHEKPGTRARGHLTPIGAPPAPVSMRVIGVETLPMEGGSLRLVRLAVEGNTTLEAASSKANFYAGAPIDGEVSVELTSGFVVSADIRSTHPSYDMRRVPLRLQRTSAHRAATS
jgi:hypothetical protein